MGSKVYGIAKANILASSDIQAAHVVSDFSNTERHLSNRLQDVPAHAYQLTYESSPRWSSFFASAPEILQYWKDVATKYDVRKHMRFQQKCIGARWHEATNKWYVQLKDLSTGVEYQDSSDVLVTGEGVLNEWKWPDIEGIQSFKGNLLHSANWDPQIDGRSWPNFSKCANCGGHTSELQRSYKEHSLRWLKAPTWKFGQSQTF